MRFGIIFIVKLENLCVHTSWS